MGLLELDMQRKRNGWPRVGHPNAVHGGCHPRLLVRHAPLLLVRHEGREGGAIGAIRERMHIERNMVEIQSEKIEDENETVEVITKFLKKSYFLPR